MKPVRLSSKPLPLGASYQPFQIGFTETSPELNFGSNLTILKFWTFILDGAYYSCILKSMTRSQKLLTVASALGYNRYLDTYF